MIARKTVLGLSAAVTISLAVASSALAGPAGDEYLPKIPHSGAHSASKSPAQGTAGTTTLQPDTSGSGSVTTTESKSKAKPKGEGKSGKKSKDASNAVPPPSSGSGGSGGDDSSGSILLNPIVLLMIAAVIAAAVGMILRRRQVTGDAEPAPHHDPERPPASSPRTPDGEIVAGTDKAT